MDEDGYGSIRIMLSWYVTEINLRWNNVKLWIVNILVWIGIWT